MRLCVDGSPPSESDLVVNRCLCVMGLYERFYAFAWFSETKRRLNTTVQFKSNLAKPEYFKIA